MALSKGVSATERWKEIEDEIQREAYGSSDYGQTLRHFHTPVHRDYRKIAAKRIAELEKKVSNEMMDAVCKTDGCPLGVKARGSRTGLCVKCLDELVAEQEGK